MRSPRPPRLALGVLERLVPDGASLAGDLIEEYRRGRSRTWVWWQVLAAVLVALPGQGDEIRPLRLVDLQPVEAVERARRMSLRFARINLSASPLPGIGGLGIVMLATLLTILAPVVWLALVLSIASGILLGIALIAMRRQRVG